MAERGTSRRALASRQCRIVGLFYLPMSLHVCHFGRPRPGRFGVCLLMACAAPACEQREAPREIRFEIPAIIVSRDMVSVSVQAVSPQGVSAQVTEGASYVVEPKDLAAVNKAGLLRCEQSGDGKLSVSVAGVSRSAALRCRMVDHLEAPKAERVELTAGPFKPHVRVVDKAGNELGDVEVSFFSKNSGVAYPKDGALVPKLVGTASLVARVGQVSAEFKVDVVRRVVAEALPIEQNRKIYFSLDPGKYELKVRLPVAHRLSVEWRGAPYCNSASDGLEHTAVCALRAEGGGVVFDNPAYLKDGSKTLSVTGVELYEVP